ncbi:GNAT family N-acetyltransferase [Sabulilitoribacter multivorans]|uniref:GNAT family N-acetyltransferase n=1 Tax=Flaviramulus multivorans TaxID=1304750 RepID=A0ABS9IHP3_9FLAO|nr:GNAT family N-acetyltransferase [Flaviramulus multivorans]MCF7560160.1 GNAT family N-acetyltransferase [Flaviramulus multivorans]
MINISDNTQLKAINLNNHDQLVDLMNALYPPAYKHLWEQEDCSWYLNQCYNKEQLNKELNETETCYYFVLYNNKVSGILRVNFNKALNQEPEKLATYVHRIYISEEIQGKGVAKQLFEWVETQAIKNNSELIWLEAMDSQEQALKFYKKQGFKVVGGYRLKFKRIHKHLKGILILVKDLQ